MTPHSPTSTSTDGSSDIALAHRNAVQQWRTYFASTSLDNAEAPEASLLSVLANVLENTDRTQWPDLLAAAGLLNEDDRKVMEQVIGANADENLTHALPHQRASLVFLQALQILHLEEQTEIEQMNALSKGSYSEPRPVSFVRQIWDGYFYWACAVGKVLCPEATPSQWPMRLPSVCEFVGKGKEKEECWHQLTPKQLLNLEQLAPKTLAFFKQSSNAVIQTRFAHNEYQMPALYLSTKYKRPERFNAVRKDVDAVLRTKDLGWLAIRSLHFAVPTKTQEPVRNTPKSFGLPDLLWALSPDGGL
jgi:hypothetical protein